MSTFSIHEAKTHLSRLLKQAAMGEEIIIARAGEPVARLMPIQPEAGLRKPGEDADRLWIAEDFDAPLGDEILRDFEGG